MNRHHPRFGKTSNSRNRSWIAILSEVPNEAGLYAVWVGDECVYIGISKSLRERLIAHNLKEVFTLLGVSHVTWISTGKTYYPHNPQGWNDGREASRQRRDMERFLISKHRPRLNGKNRSATITYSLKTRLEEGEVTQ